MVPILSPAHVLKLKMFDAQLSCGRCNKSNLHWIQMELTFCYIFFVINTRFNFLIPLNAVQANINIWK